MDCNYIYTQALYETFHVLLIANIVVAKLQGYVWKLSGVLSLYCMKLCRKMDQ